MVILTAGLLLIRLLNGCEFYEKGVNAAYTQVVCLQNLYATPIVLENIV